MTTKTILVVCLLLRVQAEDGRSFLDNFLGLFRPIKLSFSRSQRTDSKSKASLRTLHNNHKLQEILNQFPCSLNNARSEMPPTSVHTLRPGDIDVIGAMGDSLTAGNALTATNPIAISFEDRGKSFSGGGEGNWKQYLTLPNILKNFNGNLLGYSLRASLTIERESQFNVAETGAISGNTPYMAKILITRMKKDLRVNIELDWKMITYMIGANDFCSEMCYYKDPKIVLLKHKKDLLMVLRQLRDNLPRTIVNLVVAPHLEFLDHINNVPLQCQLFRKFECPCLSNRLLADPDRKSLYYDIMAKWQLLEIDIANRKEFDRDNFTVVAQPFTKGYILPTTQKGDTDLSYLSVDCFHFSQKGNALAANGLWNSILEPVGRKLPGGRRSIGDLNCPTENHPYIFTRRNSD